MLIRHPENHLPIGGGTHIIARIPLHHARLALPRQAAHGAQMLRLDLHLPLRVPHDGILVISGPTDQEAAIGCEAHVPLPPTALAPVLVASGGCPQIHGLLRAHAVGAQGAIVGVEEQMSGGGVGAQQDGSTIVGEFEAGPVRFARFDALLRHVGSDVEGGEGGFVVIPQVVEEDRVGGGGGNGDDRGRWVVRGEVRGQEVEAGLRRLGFQVPEADGGVAGAGEEGVGGRTEGEGGDFVGVALEVAQELVVVGGEIADAVVDFGARVNDGGGVVGEAREMDTILLREELFDMSALFGIVQLYGVVVAGGKHEFARVVEVQGCDRRFWLSEPEVLGMRIIKQVSRHTRDNK